MGSAEFSQEIRNGSSGKNMWTRNIILINNRRTYNLVPIFSGDATYLLDICIKEMFYYNFNFPNRMDI